MDNRKWLHIARTGAVMMLIAPLAGCIDKDYDLGEIDKTIGVGGEYVSLPGDNSTEAVMLDEVLDLGDANFLVISEDGNYNIDVTDDNPFTAHMWVDDFTVPSKTYKGTYQLDLGDLVPQNSMRKIRRATDEIVFDAPMVEMDFTYPYNTRQITSLDYVGVSSSTLSITLAFSQGVKKCLNNIKEVRFTFPKCVDCGKVAYKGDSISLGADNMLRLSDVNPSEDLNFVLHVKGIKLDGKYDGSYMTYTKGEGFKFHGALSIGGTVKETDVNISKISTAGALYVDGTAVLSRMKVATAKGCFSPRRAFGSVGGVSLRNVPSFLTDDEVDLDLYDPQLNINVYSDVPFATKVTGAIVSKDSQGKEILRMEVPEFSYKANGESVISVRRRPAATESDTTIIVMPDICDIIRHLPDSIALVDLEGEGDDTQTAEVVIDKKYRGSIVLSVASGIALGTEAKIVYNDKYTGWNDQVKDVSFVETVKDGVKTIDGYLNVTAQVENKIPAYLTLVAYGIDASGQRIGSDRLAVEVEKTIQASKDGKTAAVTEEVIKIRPKDNGVFKILDGIEFKVLMTAKDEKGASPVTGVLLNAYKQTIKVKDIKIQKYGKVAVDLN